MESRSALARCVNLLLPGKSESLPAVILILHEPHRPPIHLIKGGSGHHPLVEKSPVLQLILERSGLPAIPSSLRGPVPELKVKEVVVQGRRGG